MTMRHVVATTVEYHDSQSNSHKFYRTYAVDRFAVFQWGRVGATGQWNAASYGGHQGAMNAANDKIHEKIAGGYTGQVITTFSYDDTLRPINPADKDTLKPLHDAFMRSGRSGSGTAPAPTPRRAAPAPAPAPTPTPVAAVLDRHGEFTARALAAVTMAVTDSQAALVELALLREQWEELEQIHARAGSYLNTLDTMLLAPATS